MKQLNKELASFGKKIIKICKKNKVTPILYGSLAYSIYTNKKIKVNDLDFYIPEKSFKNIMNSLNKEKITFKYSKEWHTAEINYKNAKVELDSIDFWYTQKAKTYSLEFNGEEIKIISLKDLTKVYKTASENKHNSKREQNRKKYEQLKKLN
jgi:hypothetical protein